MSEGGREALGSASYICGFWHKGSHKMSIGVSGYGGSVVLTTVPLCQYIGSLKL